MPFHHFGRLPPELRQEIWRLALSFQAQPAFVHYKRGCWVFDFSEGPDRLTFFDHMLLDRVKVNLPVYHVNREARSIALKHSHEDLSFDRDNSCSQTIVTRPFNPVCDALYFKNVLEFIHFHREAMDMRTEDDDEIIMANIYQLAIPSTLFQADSTPGTIMHYLGNSYCNIKTIYIVRGPGPFNTNSWTDSGVTDDWSTADWRDCTDCSDYVIQENIDDPEMSMFEEAFCMSVMDKVLASSPSDSELDFEFKVVRAVQMA